MHVMVLVLVQVQVHDVVKHNLVRTETDHILELDLIP